LSVALATAKALVPMALALVASLEVVRCVAVLVAVARTRRIVLADIATSSSLVWSFPIQWVQG
jgi:hypothetical protein